MMVTAAAREIQDGELVFVGMRLPLLAFLLAQATHAPRAVGLYENGLIRARAAPQMLYTMSDRPNVTGATRATDMLEIMGLLQSGRVQLGFVGAAQVDRFGNLNSTWVQSPAHPASPGPATQGGRRTRLPGSGGASDIASLAGRLVVLLPHRRRRLPERVDYCTSPGYGTGAGWRERTGLPRGGPAAVITDRAVLRFHPETREAMLASYHGGFTPESIAAETGWAIQATRELRETEPPSEADLAFLRRLDPEGFWLGRPAP
ncbi:MAG: CoA-transferase subunit beta [Acidobacteriota bacterium]